MTTQVRIIKSEAEYRRAHARLVALMDVDLQEGSDLENEFELLRLVVGAYENEHK